MLEQEKLREEMEKKFDAETVPELHPIIIRALENGKLKWKWLVEVASIDFLL